MAVSNFENQQFKALMEAAGWTQTETARRLKVSEGSISGYISGANPVPPAKLELLRRLVDEAKLKDNSMAEEYQSRDLQKTGYEGMSKDVLEAVFKTFASHLCNALPHERVPIIDKLKAIVTELNRLEEPKP